MREQNTRQERRRKKRRVGNLRVGAKLGHGDMDIIDTASKASATAFLYSMRLSLRRLTHTKEGVNRMNRDFSGKVDSEETQPYAKRVGATRSGAPLSLD